MFFPCRAAQYGCAVENILSGSYWGAYSSATFVEMYSYHPAGGVTAKQLTYNGNYYDSNLVEQTSSGTLEADYTFDTSGRVATVNNPANPVELWTGTYDYAGNPIFTPCQLSYSYDSMGRPSGVTNAPVSSCGYPWVESVQYDYAGRLTAMTTLTGSGYPFSYSSESRAYNVNGQLSSINGVQYVYSAGQNNGQVSQVIDGLSGETITYQYDALKRLISANSAPTTGSSPTAWTQTYQYDGFGNLTAKTSNGTASQMPANPATNQLTYAYYDANGNMTSGAGASMTYDTANRLATTGGGQQAFQYAPDNKRILETRWNGYYSSQQLTFYGGQGEKLGLFLIQPPQGSSTSFSFQSLGITIRFGGRTVVDQSVALLQDRLGTNRTSGARFYPYGDEITSPQTSNDRVKFATYTRDSYTGLDYAQQRFYASTYGRFNTPDPFGASASSLDPASWNRYSYTEGDPVNLNDPEGLFATCPSGQHVVNNQCVPDGGGDGGGGSGLESRPVQRPVKKPSPERGLPAPGVGPALSADCMSALGTAQKSSASVNRALGLESTFQSAVQGTSIPWQLLAAIAIRETGVLNTTEVDGAGVGVGIFQITVSPTSGVTAAQAGNSTFAANWAATLLSNNMATLSSEYPNLSSSQLLQATAASFNFGTGNISGNPNTIDVGSAGNNYGSNVLGLINCFPETTTQ